MYSLTRKCLLGYAAAGVLAISLTSTPIIAEDFSQHPGPVGPHEPILTTVGSKRVIAFYEPESGNCAMHIVVWDSADTNGGSAARVRVTLDPRQKVQIDSADNESLDLQCGESAGTLAIVDNSKVMAGAAN